MIKHYQRLCKTTSASSSSALDGSLAAAPGAYWAKVDLCSCSFFIFDPMTIQLFSHEKCPQGSRPVLCAALHRYLRDHWYAGLFFLSIKLRPLYLMFNLGAKFFGPSSRDDHQGQRYCLRQCHHVLQGECTTTPRPRKTNLHHPSNRWRILSNRITHALNSITWL